MRASVLFSVGLVSCLLACGDDGAGGNPDTVTGLIGVDGGTVELAGGGKVVIPPGALAETTEIRITKLEVDDVAPLPSHMQATGKPYAFEPSSLVLSVAAKLEVPFEGDAADVRLMKLPNRVADTSQWTTVFPIEKLNGKVSGEMTRLGVLWAARPRRNSGVISLPDGAIVEDAGSDAAMGDSGAMDAGMDAAVDAGTDAGMQPDEDASVEPSYPWLALEQFGTEGSDVASDVAVDGDGNVFVAGTTGGQLPGQTSVGYEDAFVRKYDANDTLLWTRQFGTADSDLVAAVAVDGDGNVFVVGYTYGEFEGLTRTSFTDIFVRKYDGNGAVLWTRQFGTTGQSFAGGIAADADGNVFVVGNTGGNGTLPGQTSAGLIDAFVRKYDGSGVEQWTRQFGTSGHDYAYTVATDAAGAAFVVGTVSGALPGQTDLGNGDGFLRKYDGSGVEQWTRQFGTTDSDYAQGVAVAGDGAVVVVGVLYSAFAGQTSAGGGDAFVRRYDGSGAEQWTRQFGTTEEDAAGAVAIAADGAVAVVGITAGALPGQVHVGSKDAFVRKYDSSGVAQWTHQFGTPSLDPNDEGTSGSDETAGVALAADGAVIVVGSTNGTLPGETGNDSEDAFIAKFAP